MLTDVKRPRQRPAAFCAEAAKETNSKQMNRNLFILQRKAFNCYFSVIVFVVIKSKNFY